MKELCVGSRDASTSMRSMRAKSLSLRPRPCKAGKCCVCRAHSMCPIFPGCPCRGRSTKPHAEFTCIVRRAMRAARSASRVRRETVVFPRWYLLVYRSCHIRADSRIVEASCVHGRFLGRDRRGPTNVRELAPSGLDLETIRVQARVGSGTLERSIGCQYFSGGRRCDWSRSNHKSRTRASTGRGQ